MFRTSTFLRDAVGALATEPAKLAGLRQMYSEILRRGGDREINLWIAEYYGRTFEVVDVLCVYNLLLVFEQLGRRGVVPFATRAIELRDMSSEVRRD